jgi:subtilase family serine protease
MKLKHYMLGASIALALASPLLAQAGTTASTAIAGINTSEAPRITAVINSNNLVTIPKTFVPFNVQPTARVADTAMMNHLQLILRPSAQRQAAAKQLIADQHDKNSPRFHQWITPEQFGANFGVTDADIATVTSWLTSHGFTVNNVYPNKTQIDISGTSAQVRAAFHTQENLYTVRQTVAGVTTPVTRRSNDSNIVIPAALQGVVAGVMGLNDFHVQAYAQKPHMMKWNSATKSYEPTSAADIKRQQVAQQVAAAAGGTANKFAGGTTGSKTQAVGLPGYTGIRGLTPYDMNHMYDSAALISQGITGAGVTIAVVEDGDMNPSDWYTFVSAFNLTQYGGTFAQVNPAPPTGTTNCIDPWVAASAVAGEPIEEESSETVLDAEWSTAMAPGANVVVASCSDFDTSNNPTTSNAFGGVFIAATNEINQTSGRPNIISASYGYGEFFIDAASKVAMDAMWQQADAEGISVFVSTGDSGSNPSFNGDVINGQLGNSAIDANAFATSPYTTGVGGTDTADVLDKTTSTYFNATTNAYGGSAKGYVPEIPWNTSCGNGVASAAFGYANVVQFCQTSLMFDQDGYYITSEAGSGGPSSINVKPTWQAGVYNAQPDGVRDLPDVSLFAGSWGGYTWAVICTGDSNCQLDSTGQPTSAAVALEGGTSLAAPMFAGLQARIDQAMGSNGTPANQGNAAPVLYALAQQEYGTATVPNNASLANCASNYNTGSGNTGCVFHNIVRGSNSTECYQPTAPIWTTNNCYYLGTIENGSVQIGLTSMQTQPTSYTATNRAYGAHAGWNMTSGLGSVDAVNLLSAWKKYASSAL